MKLIQSEQIELSNSEITALVTVHRMGVYLAKEASDPDLRATGEAIYKACDALGFIRSTKEDPNEPILRRKDIQCIYDGTCDLEGLKAILPSVCADLIDRTIKDACDKAQQDGYGDGYAIGFDEGYNA